MKTLKNIKNYSLGFVVGVACVSSIAYGASNGSIGASFLEVSGVWKLVGVNITDNSITSTQLALNSVENSELAANSVTQAKVSGGYVDRQTDQTVSGVKTFSDGINSDVTGNVTGNVVGNLTGNVTGNLTGNATSATRLQTSRTIAGVGFDGTANIDIPFNNLSSRPTTISGYAITDAVTTHSDQSISGIKTFTDTLTVSKGPDIKMSFVDTNSSGLGQIQQGSSSLVLASNTSLSFNAGSDLANGSPSGQALVIRSTGDVGIGTSIPAYKLDVSGQTRSTGGFIGNLIGDVTGNVSGNAGTVTNGVYTVGNQIIGGIKTFTSNMTLPGAPTTWYNLNVGSIGSTTTYAYTALCSQNSNGDCSGNGGVVLGLANPNAGVNFATSGNSFVNNGNFGVGTNSPSYKLDVNGQARATGGFIGNLTGNADTVTNGVYTNTAQTITGQKTFSSQILANAGIQSTSFIYTSDRRFKENIETIQSPLKTVQALRGVTWNWKKDGKADIGFIAQEVEEVLPELVYTDKNGYKGVQYGNMVGLLVEAVKEQQKQIDELNAQLNALQK